MNSDRELLELAAKAAAYEWDADVAELRAAQNPPLIALWIPGASTAWNPLEDDGQALRLAVRLRLKVYQSEFASIVSMRMSHAYVAENHDENGDAYAATRRAIVRAAAEIGKAKP